MKNFSERLDSLRRTGESKKDFASRLGVNPVQLSRYYSGIGPGRRVLERIARRTGASMDWLLHGRQLTEGIMAPRRLGAKTDRPLNDHDLLDLACSYLDELKSLNRHERELVKEILRELYKNPGYLEKLNTYLGFVKFEQKHGK